MRRPGVVLRVSRIRVFVPASASTQARVAVATPDIMVKQVERHPFGGEQRPGIAAHRRDDLAGLDPIAVGRVEGDREIARRSTHHCDRVRGDREPGQRARRAGDELTVGHRVRTSIVA